MTCEGPVHYRAVDWPAGPALAKGFTTRQDGMARRV